MASSGMKNFLPVFVSVDHGLKCGISDITFLNIGIENLGENQNRFFFSGLTGSEGNNALDVCQFSVLMF